MGKPENKVADYLKERTVFIGGFWRKYQSPGRRGVPDYILFFPGIVVFAETKSPEGDLSPAQTRELNKIAKFLIPVAIIDSRKAVDDLMDIILVNIEVRKASMTEHKASLTRVDEPRIVLPNLKIVKPH